MIDQTPVNEEPKPESKPEPPSPSIGTGIKGDGPADGFGLSGGNGNGFMGGGSGRSGGGSRWGWYASQVQARIADALRQNPHTRSASLRIQIRIWPNNTGRITRVQLVESTGDQSVDNAIRDEVLTGLQLQEPPPSDMPTPITLRLTAKRPN